MPLSLASVALQCTCQIVELLCSSKGACLAAGLHHVYGHYGTKNPILI